MQTWNNQHIGIAGQSGEDTAVKLFIPIADALRVLNIGFAENVTAAEQQGGAACEREQGVHSKVENE